MKKILNIIIPLCIFMCGCSRNKDNVDSTFILDEHRSFYAGNSFTFNKGKYEIKDGLLMFTDKTTLKSAVVSNEPNNVSLDESNPAYVGNMSSVFVNNDYLYTIKKDMANNRIKIEKSNLDRTDIKTLFNDDGMQIANIIKIKENLYFFISSPVTKLDETTGLKVYTSDGQSQLMCLDLQKDKVYSCDIYESGLNAEAIVFGSNENELYYTVSCIKNEDYFVQFKKSYINDLNSSEIVFEISGERASGNFIDNSDIYYQILNDDNSVSYNVYNITTKEHKQLDNSRKVIEWFEKNGK